MAHRRCTVSIIAGLWLMWPRHSCYERLYSDSKVKQYNLTLYIIAEEKIDECEIEEKLVF